MCAGQCMRACTIHVRSDQYVRYMIAPASVDAIWSEHIDKVITLFDCPLQTARMMRFV